jgi:hypothetical protein
MKQPLGKRWTVTIAVHVGALGLALLLVPAFQRFDSLCEYRCGLGVQNFSPVPFLWPVELGAISFAYFCIQAVAFALLGFGIRRGLSWLALGGVFATFVISAILYLNGPPPYLSFMEGFQKRIKSKVTVADVQGLRSDLLALQANGQAFRELRGKDKPELLDRLADKHSPSALLYFNATGAPAYLIIDWGGGFERYGLFYALDGRSPFGDKDFDFISWSNSVYFFHSKH